MLLAQFLLTSLLIELTPGPNMGWLALLSLRRGRLAGLAAVAGIALGLAIAGAAAALGLSLLISTTPWLFQLLRFAGAAYLVYLAWEAWTDADGDGLQDANAPLRHFFTQGLVSNMLNAKAYLVYAAVLPQFLGSGGSPRDIALLSAVYVAVATLVHASLVLLAGSASKVLANEDRRKPLSRLSAVLLLAIAVWFFWAAEAPH